MVAACDCRIDKALGKRSIRSVRQRTEFAVPQLLHFA